MSSSIESSQALNVSCIHKLKYYETTQHGTVNSSNPLNSTSSIQILPAFHSTTHCSLLNYHPAPPSLRLTRQLYFRPCHIAQLVGLSDLPQRSSYFHRRTYFCVLYLHTSCHSSSQPSSSRCSLAPSTLDRILCSPFPSLPVAMSNIGIMDPAFFVGKNVLLAWLNDFFQAGYTKVEQMSNGAMACQILDAIYPGKVPLGKVNFDAKTQPESVANFKVLQGVFDRESITKYVDVSKLLNGKFQDNLEFLQWLKSYFDKNYSGQEYNAAERREQARQQYKKGHKFAGSSSTQSAIKSSFGGGAPATRPAASSITKQAPTLSKVAAKPAAATGVRSASGSTGAKRVSPPVSARGGQGSTAEVAELTTQVRELTTAMEGLEKERGFYFGKLREIEILLQDDSTAQAGVDHMKQQVLDILYKTDDASEFQAPEGEELAAAEDGGDQGLLDDAELTTDNTF